MYYRIGLAVLLVLCLAGCPRKAEITVTPNAATLSVGQSITIGAASTDAADTDFSWSVDNPDIVALNTETGTSVTVSALAPGAAQLTATGVGSGATAKAMLVVPTPAAEGEPEPEGEEPEPEITVLVAPMSAALDAGRVIVLTASSTDDEDDDFTWAVDNADVVALAAETGTSIEVATLATGSAWITATGASSGVSGTSVVSVLAPLPVEEEVSVSVTPMSASIEIGNGLTLHAASTDAADTDFNWTVADDSIVSLSGDGGVSVAATGLAAGVTTVTATGASSGATATAAISVLTGGSGIGNLLLPGGLDVTILDVAIPDDLRPEVKFRAVNTRGDNIPQGELTTAQFLIAYLDPAPPAGTTARYISYNTRIETAGDNSALQATYDGNALAGLTTNMDGTLTYKFAAALPDTYDVGATHAVGGQLRRTSALDGVAYPANVTFEFVPDGKSAALTRDIVATNTCNECHTRLSFHGNIRREIALCILCHNPGSTDANTGNTVDMPVLIHKIHRGKNLPSVQAGEPYQIIGFRDTVHDYSDVVFPQDIRHCTVCHDEGSAAQASVYLTHPTLDVCGSCHDRTWFGASGDAPEGYASHPVPQENDSQCAVCHTPASIQNAHVTLAGHSENPGLNLEITQISANAEDGTLVIDFHAAYGDGSPITDLSVTASVGAIVGWPSWEYEQYYSESIRGSANLESATSATGEYRYTFTNQLPTDAGLSFGIVMTGRIRFDLNEVTQTVGLADNSLMYFTLDGSEPVARRPIVDEDQCDKCHHEIRFHGEQRVGVGTCVMCHNVYQTDEGRRPVEELPAETVNFKEMIHRIHRGEALENGYTAYGFGNIAHDYSHVVFPGRLEQCSICHGNHSVNLPVAPEALPTAYNEQVILPERAACVSCHDSLTANVHAMLAGDAASGAESCAVCHGAGAGYAVAAVHVLEP